MKDAISYFRMAINPEDDEALKRVINTHARGIGATTIGKISSAALASGVSMFSVITDPEEYKLDVNSGTLKKLRGFVEIISDFRAASHTMNAEELARHIITRTGLLSQYLSENTPENISKVQNLEELLKSAHEFVEENTEEDAGTDTTMSQPLPACHCRPTRIPRIRRLPIP